MATLVRRGLLPLLLGLAVLLAVLLGLVARLGVAAAVQPATPALTMWQLTPAGCCAASRWSRDGQRIFYYHRPDEGPAGLWSVDLGGQMAFLQERYGYLSADERVLVSAEAGQTVIEQLDSGASQYIPNSGVDTLPSPDGSRVAYFHRIRAGDRYGDSIERIVVAPLDGGEPRSLAELARADHLRWFPDSRRLMVFGWQPDGTSPGLWVIDVDSGAVTQIVTRNFITAPLIAPSGEWITFLATLQPEPGDNGVWIVRPDGTEARRIPYTRAMQWSADSQALLALMPVPGGKEIHRYDLATGSQDILVSRAQLDFDVDADDWSVAPDGRHILYRSSRDRALWVIQLAP